MPTRISEKYEQFQFRIAIRRPKISLPIAYFLRPPVPKIISFSIKDTQEKKEILGIQIPDALVWFTGFAPILTVPRAHVLAMA